MSKMGDGMSVDRVSRNYKDTKKFVEMIKSARGWVDKFWDMIEAKDYTRAKNYLKTIESDLKRFKEVLKEGELEDMAESLKALKNALGIVDDVAKIPEAFAAGVSWEVVVGAVVIFVMLAAMVGHCDELDPSQRETERKKRLEEAVKRMKELPPDPTLNPVVAFNLRAPEIRAQMRRLCPCAKARAKAQLSQLGRGFEGQALAFATVGPVPMGQSGKPQPAGARAGGGSAPPDPFAFPSRGGAPLPVPGKNGGTGPTLPGANPAGACMWPLCQQLRRTMG